MAFDAGTIVGKIKADFRDFKNGMKQVKREGEGAFKSVSNAGKKMNRTIKDMAPTLRKASVGLSAIGAAAGLLAKNLADAASDYDEALNKTGLAFGELADEMIAQSEVAADTMGMSKGAYLEATSTIGLMLGSMKLSTKEARTQSIAYAQLAADMGSAFNAEPVEVMNAFQSAISGSTEPLRRFGVVITQARLEQTAMNMGLIDGKGQLDAYSRSMALQKLIMEDTAAVQGDFMNTADGLANAQRRLKAMNEDLRIAIGKFLLPAFQALTAVGIKVTQWLQGLSPEAKKFTAIAIGLAAAVGLIGGPLLLMVSLIPSLIAGFTALGTVLTMLSGPIGLVTLLVGALFIAWQTNWLGIRDVTNVVITFMEGKFRILSETAKIAFENIKGWAKTLFSGLKTIFTEGGDLLGVLWDGVMAKVSSITESAFNGLKTTMANAINWMIDKLNAFVGAVNAVAKYVPGLSNGKDEPALLSPIPKLAKGGIVTSPTLAVVGEGGESEAVIPLSKLGNMGGTNNFYFDGAIISGEDDARNMFNRAFGSMRPRLGV